MKLSRSTSDQNPVLSPFGADDRDYGQTTEVGERGLGHMKPVHLAPVAKRFSRSWSRLGDNRAHDPFVDSTAPRPYRHMQHRRSSRRGPHNAGREVAWPDGPALRRILGPEAEPMFLEALALTEAELFTIAAYPALLSEEIVAAALKELNLAAHMADVERDATRR